MIVATNAMSSNNLINHSTSSDTLDLLGLTSGPFVRIDNVLAGDPGYF